jgi:hypothetical protein
MSTMTGVLINLLAKFLPSALPRLVAERPDLLINHAHAYVELVKAEVSLLGRFWIRRTVAFVVAAFAGLAFVVLGGVALMLSATVPLEPNGSWLLFVVPIAVLVLSVGAAIVGFSARSVPSTDMLRTQIQLDLQALRDAKEAA